jgi:hypothetical protein
VHEHLERRPLELDSLDVRHVDDAEFDDCVHAPRSFQRRKILTGIRGCQRLSSNRSFASTLEMFHQSIVQF